MDLAPASHDNAATASATSGLTWAPGFLHWLLISRPPVAPFGTNRPMPPNCSTALMVFWKASVPLTADRSTDSVAAPAADALDHARPTAAAIPALTKARRLHPRPICHSSTLRQSVPL